MIFFFFFSLICSSEFKGIFKKRLHELKIKQYHTKTSVFPKISLCERGIKSCKEIFFRILYEFGSITYDSALRLTASVYNSRVHASLHGNSPINAHFNSHASSEICRKNLEAFKVRQTKIKNFFSLHPEKVFKVGDQVLLAKVRHKFHRSNVLHHSDFGHNPEKVIDVDRSCLPWTYVISNHENRKYYFFELKRVSPLYGKLTAKPSILTSTQKILVLDYEIINPPFLRSGKSVGSKATVFYTIQRSDKVEKVNGETLRSFKKILGPKILEYSPMFDTPENQHLKV